MTPVRRNGFRVPEQLLLPWSPRATISVPKAAAMIDCSRTTVLVLIHTRMIRGYQLQPSRRGSPWRVNYESVLQYLAKLHDEAGIEPRFEL